MKQTLELGIAELDCADEAHRNARIAARADGVGHASRTGSSKASCPARQKSATGSCPQRAILFRPRDCLLIALVGGLITVMVVLVYIRSTGEPGGVEHGRAAVLSTLALASSFLTAALSRLRTRAAWLVSAATAASPIVVVQMPPVARALHLEPLHLADWTLAVAGAVLAIVPLGLAMTRRSRMRGDTSTSSGLEAE